MAVLFHLSVNSLLHVFQILLIVGPPAAFVITRRLCTGLQEHHEGIALHGIETGQVIRLPEGGYVEKHRPVDAYRRRQIIGASGETRTLTAQPVSPASDVQHDGAA